MLQLFLCKRQHGIHQVGIFRKLDDHIDGIGSRFLLTIRVVSKNFTDIGFHDIDPARIRRKFQSKHANSGEKSGGKSKQLL